MFRIKNKEILVEGVKKGNFAITAMSLGDHGGSFLPIPMTGRAAVGGKACVKSPLSFAMAGCKNQQGAVAVGQGQITTRQTRAKDGTRYLVVGDEGKCSGMLVGAPTQAPGQCNCKFRLSSSGQVSGTPPVSETLIGEKTADGRLEVEYLDADGKPISGARCTITTDAGMVLLDGKELDSAGRL